MSVRKIFFFWTVLFSRRRGVPHPAQRPKRHYTLFIFGYVFYSRSVTSPLQITLPYVTRRPPLPPSKSHLCIPSWFPLTKRPDHPPPPLPTHSCSPITSTHSRSTWCQGCPPPLETVNLHWPPASDGLQPMPSQPPPTLTNWDPRRLRTIDGNYQVITLFSPW